MACILLMDDDEAVRNLLARALRESGYEVVEAGDGREGVRLFRTAPSDLVITDLVMPEKEGIETILELRQDFPDLKVIAISGGGEHGQQGYLQAARLLGANRTLSKPFQLDALLTAVREVLREAPSPTA